MRPTVDQLERRHLAILSGLASIRGITVDLVGFDEQGDPVVCVHDANGERTWAARKSDFEQRMFPDVMGEVTHLTDDEELKFNPAHYEFLCASFPFTTRRS